MNICFYTFTSPVTIYIANQLMDSGKLSAVILQRPRSPVGTLAFLAGRVRRYGVLKVLDELAFHVYYRVFLKRSDERLRASYFPKEVCRSTIQRGRVPVYEVDSLNSEQGKTLLKQLQPDLVIMESRELIAEEALAIPRVGFVGCHPGILPEYRGVYASFWAMARRDPDKVGVSVYLAGRGVDTGGIIAQRCCGPRFSLQHFKVESERLLVEGLSDLLAVLEMAGQGTLKTHRKPQAPSCAFTHPGLSEYLRAIRRRSRP